MKKKLTLLALTCAPTLSMAEVVLYGAIEAGYSVKSTKSSGQETAKRNGINDLGSSIGIKGNEALGNGLNAIWQVESGINIANGQESNNVLGTNDSFVGLSGDFGKIRLGALGNYGDSSMGSIDPWSYSAPDMISLGLGSFTRLNGRYSSVRYDSPDLGGFSFVFGGSPRDNNPTPNGEANNKAQISDINTTRVGNTKAKYYAGLAYANSGFFTQYQYLLNKNTATKSTGKSVDGKSHRIQMGYDANNVIATIGFQKADNVPTYSALNTIDIASSKEAALTLGYQIGNILPRFSYAHGWDVKSVDGVKQKNTKYDQYILGVEYSLSKRTTALAQIGYLSQGQGLEGNNKIKTKISGSAIGIKHVF